MRINKKPCLWGGAAASLVKCPGGDLNQGGYGGSQAVSEALHIESRSRSCLTNAAARSRSRVVASGLQKSWKSRQVERCEAKAIKELEKELRETAQKEKEVFSLFNLLWCHFFCTALQEKKRKLAEKHQKKLENQKKGEVVQKVWYGDYISPLHYQEQTVSQHRSLMQPN